MTDSARREEKKKEYVCHQESHFMRRSSRAYSSSLFVSLEQSTLRENSETNEAKKETLVMKDRSDCKFQIIDVFLFLSSQGINPILVQPNIIDTIIIIIPTVIIY